MTRTQFMLLAATLSLTSGAIGAAQDKPQAVILKGKAPVSDAILDVRLPAAERN